MKIDDKMNEIIALVEKLKKTTDDIQREELLTPAQLGFISDCLTELQEGVGVAKYLFELEALAEEVEAVSAHQLQADEVVESEEELVETLTESETEEELAALEEVIVEEPVPVAPPIEEAPQVPELEDALEGEQISIQETEEVTEEDNNETEVEETSKEELLGFIQQVEDNDSLNSQDLNEAFSEEEPASLADQLNKQPIKDLVAAIGLNERYLYANELFEGDMEEFKKVLNTLNDFSSGAEAKIYFREQLRSQYGWDEGNELAMALYHLLERRFI
jgi:hypothetical protein